MPDQCDGSIRASTHKRDPATCSPDTHPTTGCCCYPGCDQGKCSSFTFERNIVFQPESAKGKMVETTFFAGLENFTFSKNLYWAGNASTLTSLFNASGSTSESFAAWQAGGKDAGSLIADPEFESTTAFTLKKTSPALTKIGFVPIDISKVGPLPSSGRVGSEGGAMEPLGVTNDPHFGELAGAGLVR